jgi:hypothetical protein
MPRRKPKHLIKPGEVRNPNGRPRGSVNEINQQIREAFAMLLHSQLPQLEDWLTRAAQKDPIKAADLMLRISERFLPSLSRTEITSADGQAFTPITINLPSIPQFTIGGGASAESLTLPPGEDLKELPEPQPSTDVNPTFTIPNFELSQNILRDMEEMQQGRPEEFPKNPPDPQEGL